MAAASMFGAKDLSCSDERFRNENGRQRPDTGQSDLRVLFSTCRPRLDEVSIPNVARRRRRCCSSAEEREPFPAGGRTPADRPHHSRLHPHRLESLMTGKPSRRASADHGQPPTSCLGPDSGPEHASLKPVHRSPVRREGVASGPQMIVASRRRQPSTSRSHCPAPSRRGEPPCPT